MTTRKAARRGDAADTWTTNRTRRAPAPCRNTWG